MRATYLAAAAITFFAAANAEARGCSERSSSRAVGIASCHRFGDWDQGGWAPSFATGFVFRAIPLPNDLGVCAQLGKHCDMVGALQSRGSVMSTYAGMLDITGVGWGPLRFGAEVGIGGTGAGTLGSYGGTPVRIDSFLFVSAALDAGIVFGWNRFAFRADGVAGVSSLSADLGLKTLDGRSLSAEYTYPQIEGRATLMYFVTPWMSIGGMGGYGVGDVWHAGFLVRLHLQPFDGTHG
jgi:hypothetical protein